MEGDKAEKRDDEVGSACVVVEGVDSEFTELVDVLRRPMNETDSLVDLRGVTVLEDTVAEVIDWRGTLIDVAGEPRAVLWRTELLGVGASSLSMTPNSFVDKETGEGFVEELARPEGFTLARRLAYVPGLGAADVRLEIRGILVGVSLGRPDIEPDRIEEWSFSRMVVWVLFVPFVPTEGEPAIVGSWVRLRRELSEIF